MLTWKLLIIGEVILCELNMNSRDLSGKIVKLPTTGKECRWLLTRLSSCRNLHNHTQVAVRTYTASRIDYPQFPLRS